MAGLTIPGWLMWLREGLGKLRRALNNLHDAGIVPSKGHGPNIPKKPLPSSFREGRRPE